MYIEESVRQRAELFVGDVEKNMNHVVGLKFIAVSREEMRASMPVNENTVQPMRILNGGASLVLAETLASIGANLNLDDMKKAAVGLEINANHIRPVPEGTTVTGVSVPLHIGSKTQVWETKITTEKGKLVCISRCTLAVVDNWRSL